MLVALRCVCTACACLAAAGLQPTPYEPSHRGVASDPWWARGAYRDLSEPRTVVARCGMTRIWAARTHRCLCARGAEGIQPSARLTGVTADYLYVSPYYVTLLTLVCSRTDQKADPRCILTVPGGVPPRAVVHAMRLDSFVAGVINSGQYLYERMKYKIPTILIVFT